jgi:predicted 3-demethylubiquinone-9 3-methyltransferase (glyoxalase superfamily)
MTQTEATRAAATSTATLNIGVRPRLTFKNQAEEAVNFYVSVFPNSRVVSMLRSDAKLDSVLEDKGGMPEGSVLHASFVLDGQEYTAFDGGEHFAFSDAFSLVATCETQQELDAIWNQLADGGEEGPCGWLTDKFGVSWQVVPSSLGRMMGDSEHGDPGKVVEAFLRMKKLDIATLERAYRGES